MAKAFSLVFDYEFSKMHYAGRIWAEDAYKNKDFIFSYTAASVATFLDKNPHIKYDLLTDDVNLFAKKIDAYKVTTQNLNIVDVKTLPEWTQWLQHKYCFWPIVKVAEMYYAGNDNVIKLDNDLTCLKPIDELFEHDGAVIWKFERICANGREYWGERKAARVALGTENFPIYNMGVFGLSKQYQLDAKDITNLCEKLIEVNISDISKLNDPNRKAQIWSCSEQTAVCYHIWKNKVPIREASDFFLHHCYNVHKDQVLVEANYLLR
jgi:hypothetical protein